MKGDDDDDRGGNGDDDEDNNHLALHSKRFWNRFWISITFSSHLWKSIAMNWRVSKMPNTRVKVMEMGSMSSPTKPLESQFKLILRLGVLSEIICNVLMKTTNRVFVRMKARQTLFRSSSSSALTFFSCSASDSIGYRYCWMKSFQNVACQIIGYIDVFRLPLTEKLYRTSWNWNFS